MTIAMAYAGAGLAVFLLLAFGPEDERPREGWWREWSFVAAGLVVVIAWPLVLAAWLLKAVRA